jgi:hypothetical protein
MKFICPQITQMDADQDSWLGGNRENSMLSAFSCSSIFPYLRQSASICGQFQIWLRLAAPGLLRLSAANPNSAIRNLPRRSEAKAGPQLQ